MEEQRIDIPVPDRKHRERIDLFLTREIAQVSRSRIQKLIREGFVTIDGKSVKANQPVQASQIIQVRIPRPPPQEVVPEAIPLNIIYEDEVLLVIDKPAGMVVHPAYGHATGTLVNALLGRGLELSAVNQRFRAGIVHRIDKDTSGLLVVAKTDSAHRFLAAQFERKSVKREYRTVVWGRINRPSGTIESYLSRSSRDRRIIRVSREGKNAVTHFEVENRYPLCTELRLRLETGRTHQIRVHMHHMGHPVFGDPTYNGRSGNLRGLNQGQKALAIQCLKIMRRQALHARTLGFVHPVTGETVHFTSEIPGDMLELLNTLGAAVDVK